MIDGFGCHNPGKYRLGEEGAESGPSKPQWDILHNGRPWAVKMKESITSEQIMKRVERFLNEDNLC